MLLLAVTVDELKSQLSAERKYNAQLKKMIDLQEQTNLRLAFYEEERGFQLLTKFAHIVIFTKYCHAILIDCNSHLH